MISHYGLFWSEKDVYWGKQKNKGKMLGHEKPPVGRVGAPTKAEKRNQKDYSGFVGVYCLYSGDRLLYVGEAGLSSTKSGATSSKTIFSRLREHKKGPLSGRWDRFSWFGLESCTGKCDVSVALSQLEAILISAFNPGFNKQSGTFKDATQVWQAVTDGAEGDLDTKIDRLSAQVGNILNMLESKNKKA